MQHLVLVERMSKAVSAQRNAAQKAALQAAEVAASAGGGRKRSSKGEAPEDDIAAQLGVGPVTADADLDIATQEVEQQVSKRTFSSACCRCSWMYK